MTTNIYSQNGNFLEELLNTHADRLGSAAINPEKHRVQIIYTQIDRDKNNQPHFTHHKFNAWEGRYFFPASTVKMPAAFAALEYLNDLSIEGLDEHTPMFTGSASTPQTAVTTDATAPGMIPTVAHYVNKNFIVSDNDAFNRLYELLGQRNLNERLWAKGMSNTRIISRLSAFQFDHDANKRTNPVSFISENKLLFHKGETVSSIDTSIHNQRLEKLQQGKAYFWMGELVHGPFDFSFRNYAALEDLHRSLKIVLFPDTTCSQSHFRLTKSQYELLYRAMSILPRESDYPQYDPERYYDSFVKYLMMGGVKTDWPENIRIFNKIGRAYGYLTDVAYIVDFDSGVEFMLSASVYVNENETFNDNEYEYSTIAGPFLRELGKIIYESEVERERNHTPDLTRFKISY
ncbi:MAG: hypothetical protein EA362_07430 [Saprospirales bacterium]|nr:MAG: hypothetical protein EA362_07430 [Saprospirales bacterium]